MMGGGMTGAGMGVGLLGLALFWIVILVAAVWLAGNLFPRSGEILRRPHAPESADDIAKRRYAAGEISQEEYETLRRGLEGTGTNRGES